MSSLLMIRHGQASFGAADYDVLSDVGIEQARHLGRYLATANIGIDAVYRGPRKRHIDTAVHMREAAAELGLDLAEATPLVGLDEYPAFELFKLWLPMIKEREPDLAREISTGSTRAMETLTSRWAEGHLDSGGLETFAEFDNRVESAVTRIRDEQGRGKRIAVVTSGGAIGMAVRQCLDLSPTRAFGVVWALTNSSITELRYRDADMRLYALNRLPHLPDTSLHTNV